MAVSDSRSRGDPSRGRPSETGDLPDPNRQLPSIIIYSHSGLLYWWPVWLTGYVLAAISYIYGRPFATQTGRTEWIHPDPALGITFATVLLLVIIFTNVRLRGIYSVATILAIALAVVLLGWMGFLDDIARAIPEISIFMSTGFYLTFSTALLIVWALAFFVFDRLSFWRVRPGQMTYERWIGGGEQSYDTRGMLFEKHGEDYFRHVLLGLGAGDLRLMTAGARERTIDIHNVTLVDKKVRRIQRLVAVEPDELLGDGL